MPLEQDVLNIGYQLEKLVADGKSDNETISDLLMRLKELPITLDILQKTRIGMTVNVVRKASNKDDIQTVAKSLIKSWKKLLDTQDNGKPKINRLSSSDSLKEKEKETNNSPKPAAREARSDSGTSYEVPPVKGNDPIRLQCREMLAKSLKLEERPEFNPVYIAAEIEEAAFEFFKETNSKYKNRIKSRVMNLRDKRNINLKMMIIEGEVTPEKFSKMTPEGENYKLWARDGDETPFPHVKKTIKLKCPREMACDELKSERKKITEEAIREHQLATTGGTSTGQFKCGRCGKRNTSYNQVQTRSADEPMTTFVYCMECGNRWKARRIC